MQIAHSQISSEYNNYVSLEHEWNGRVKRDRVRTAKKRCKYLMAEKRLLFFIYIFTIGLSHANNLPSYSFIHSFIIFEVNILFWRSHSLELIPEFMFYSMFYCSHLMRNLISQQSFKKVNVTSIFCYFPFRKI